MAFGVLTALASSDASLRSSASKRSGRSLIAFHFGHRSKRLSMSDKALIPAPDVLRTEGNVLLRYRAAFTSLTVLDRADKGRRIEVNDDGHVIVFDLDADQAAHLADLLVIHRRDGETGGGAP
jgi:hypothetical protein